MFNNMFEMSTRFLASSGHSFYIFVKHSNPQTNEPTKPNYPQSPTPKTFLENLGKRPHGARSIKPIRSNHRPKNQQNN